jgi:hypothetical protein
MNAKEQAQEERRRLHVQAGQRYRHFKGGEYRVIETAVLESTGELLVVYHAFRDDTIWARPLSEWNAQVEVGPGESVKRFTLIPS